MSYFILIITPLIIYFVSEFFKKNYILLNYTGDTHQKFTSKDKIPLTGGLFIFIFFSFFFHTQIYLIIFITLVFLLGIFSDLKIFNSPKIRLLVQLFILFFLIISSDLSLENTKIIVIDKLINMKFYNYCFVLFCLLILLNGTNFIDGLNTNVLGYYIIVSFFMFSLNREFFIENFDQWFLWILFLLILYLFNFFNKLFLGDSGSYVLGLIYGYLMIEFYKSTNFVSSLFIVVLVWYPCFELLFSIIRKFRFNKSPIFADTKHFHQLLFLNIKKSFKFSNLKSNLISASIINLFNLFIIFLASLYPGNSQYQMLIIISTIIIYIWFYLTFFKRIFIKSHM